MANHGVPGRGSTRRTGRAWTWRMPKRITLLVVVRSIVGWRYGEGHRETVSDVHLGPRVEGVEEEVEVRLRRARFGAVHTLGARPGEVAGSLSRPIVATRRPR